MIRMGPWRPDMPTLENPGALEALNVVPGARGSYMPLQKFQEQGNAMTARAQGAISVRAIDGSIKNFTGDATKLYLWDGVDWDDVSRLAGGAYATPSDGQWDFTKFNDVVVGVNGVDAAQSFTMASSSNFAALAGSPPIAAFVATVRAFVMMGRISTARNRVQWGGYNSVSGAWATSQTTQADQQDIPSGGDVMRVLGGEYGLVFQERAINRFSYEGPPTIFRRDEISNELGTPASYSVAPFRNLAFFLSNDGFHVVVNGSEVAAIGDRKVNSFFWNDVDPSFLYRTTASVDPINKLVFWSYAGAGNTSGTPNKLLVYSIMEEEFARGEQAMEMLHVAATQSGFTLDGLDAVSASLDLLLFSLDSRIWSGSGRILLSGFSTAHKIGFFDGVNMAATVDTTEQALVPGRRARLKSVRPAVEGGSPSVRIGHRPTLQDAVQFTSAVAVDNTGKCDVNVDSRYFRARVEMTEGDTWTSIQGVDDLDVIAGGRK